METPTIKTSNYAATAYDLASNSSQLANAVAVAAAVPDALVFFGGHEPVQLFGQPRPLLKQGGEFVHLSLPKQENQLTTRLVQVFIVDPHPSVPLANRLLYKSDQFMTDLNDQDLFFDIDLRPLLKEHNEKRVKFRDKAVKDREEMLEEVRVSGLQMRVLTIATF